MHKKCTGVSKALVFRQLCELRTFGIFSALRRVDNIKMSISVESARAYSVTTGSAELLPRWLHPPGGYIGLWDCNDHFIHYCIHLGCIHQPPWRVSGACRSRRSTAHHSTLCILAVEARRKTFTRLFDRASGILTRLPV